jgi:hypothetical protein
MPKATVHENDDAESSKTEIRFSENRSVPAPASDAVSA